MNLLRPSSKCVHEPSTRFPGEALCGQKAEFIETSSRTTCGACARRRSFMEKRAEIERAKAARPKTPYVDPIHRTHIQNPKTGTPACGGRATSGLIAAEESAVTCSLCKKILAGERPVSAGSI